MAVVNAAVVNNAAGVQRAAGAGRYQGKSLRVARQMVRRSL